MTDTVKCEPPEGLRGVDGFHWVQPPQSSEPRVRRWRWTWGLWQDGAAETTLAGYAYIEPVLTPTEVAALRAERDAAVAQAQSCVREVSAISRELGTEQAKAAALRAEVARLREALEPFAEVGAWLAAVFPDMAPIETFSLTPKGGDKAMIAAEAFMRARAALEPQT